MSADTPVRPHELLGGLPEDEWRCRCAGWSFPAKPHRGRRTRDNRREAELSWMTHRDSQPGAYGAGPGYN